MSNYIIDYLTGMYSFGIVKEAGFLSKLKKLISGSAAGKTNALQEIANKIPSVAGKKTLVGIKKNIQKIKPTAFEQSIYDAQNRLRHDQLSLYYWKPRLHEGIDREERLLRQIENDLASSSADAERVLPRVKTLLNSSSKANIPDMLYNGGDKGLRVIFNGTPSTASMSEDLARAIVADDKIVSPLIGNGGSMFMPAVKNKVSKVLATLGFLDKRVSESWKPGNKLISEKPIVKRDFNLRDYIGRQVNKLYDARDAIERKTYKVLDKILPGEPTQVLLKKMGLPVNMGMSSRLLTESALGAGGFAAGAGGLAAVDNMLGGSGFSPWADYKPNVVRSLFEENVRNRTWDPKDRMWTDLKNN